MAILLPLVSVLTMQNSFGSSVPIESSTPYSLCQRTPIRVLGSDEWLLGYVGPRILKKGAPSGPTNSTPANLEQNQKHIETAAGAWQEPKHLKSQTPFSAWPEVPSSAYATLNRSKSKS